MAAGRYSTRTIYRRVFREARPYRLHLLGMLALSLMSTPVALLTPLPLKIVVDSVLSDKPLPGFMQPVVPEFVTGSKGLILVLGVALVMIVALLAQLQRIGSLILNTYTGEKLVMDFRARLFRHAQRLSFSYHDWRGTADSIYRIQYDALALQWITTEGIV
ncbi:MAG TPA: ABC transporter transmembrane domain-containing protein, partial [Rubrobacter sp.]|nr:ABC transporter transmembrane domain-containing protein [Rubrobacter sp.]